MMESLGIDTADYRQLLFEVTGEITTDLMSGDVLAGLLSRWTGNAVDWVTTNLPRIFFKIVLFLLILLFFRFLSRISRKVVRKAIQTSSLKVSKLLERTALSVTGAAVMIFGILVAMSQLGCRGGPLARWPRCRRLHHRLRPPGHSGQFRGRGHDPALPSLRCGRSGRGCGRDRQGQRK